MGAMIKATAGVAEAALKVGEVVGRSGGRGVVEASFVAVAAGGVEDDATVVVEIEGSETCVGIAEEQPERIADSHRLTARNRMI